MFERFDLNKEQLTTIPTPHDCVIKRIHEDGNDLVFDFEKDISVHMRMNVGSTREVTLKENKKVF